MRWRSEVSRFAPDRLAEFDELIADALNNPAPVQKADQPTALQGERGLAGRERLIAQQRGERDGGRAPPEHAAVARPTGAALESAPGRAVAARRFRRGRGPPRGRSHAADLRNADSDVEGRTCGGRARAGRPSNHRVRQRVSRP